MGKGYLAPGIDVSTVARFLLEGTWLQQCWMKVLRQIVDGAMKLPKWYGKEKPVNDTNSEFPDTRVPPAVLMSSAQPDEVAAFVANVKVRNNADRGQSLLILWAKKKNWPDDLIGVAAGMARQQNPVAETAVRARISNWRGYISMLAQCIFKTFCRFSYEFFSEDGELKIRIHTAGTSRTDIYLNFSSQGCLSAGKIRVLFPSAFRGASDVPGDHLHYERGRLYPATA